MGLSFDGRLRAWTGAVDNNGMPGNVSTLYYDNVNFPGATSPSGLLEAGGSGGGVYNSLGGLVGMCKLIQLRELNLRANSNSSTSPNQALNRGSRVT